jgi:Protein of unknown function (DUF1203)
MTASTHIAVVLMNSFQLVGLPMNRFAHLFALSDADLATHHARRVVATTSPGFPCRVSLEDAQIGDELLLLPFEHQACNSPYKASGPIFVRKSAAQARFAPDVIPPYVHTRLISVRAYDAAHSMIQAEVCSGDDTRSAIESMFNHDAAAYIHLHNAKRGCFSCAIQRVGSTVPSV